MGRKDWERLRLFVVDRITEAERENPSKTTESQRELYELAGRVVKDGRESSDWAWLEPGSAAINWIFGGDPQDVGDAVAVGILAGIAVAFSDHPDFDPAWRKPLRD